MNQKKLELGRIIDLSGLLINNRHVLEIILIHLDTCLKLFSQECLH